MPVNVVADILSILTAAAGWYYMFYSRAADRLEGIESERLNRRRIRLRRAGGGVLMLLGILFFAGSQEISAVAFLAIWSCVMLLLVVIVILALIDLRLTWQLQRSRRQGPR